MVAPPLSGAPVVLVLLATYNGAAFVDEQISSILWQNDVNARILARDDGSTDATQAKLRDWAERYPDRVQILQDGLGRTGSAPGNFFRLLAAVPDDGIDYVALADQDDIWLPRKLVRGVEAMQADGTDGYSSDLIAFDDTARAAWHLAKAGEDADLDYLFQGAAAGCTYVLTARAARTVRDVLASLTNGWIPRVSHDWTIYAICRSRGFGWHRDGRAGLLYRQHGANDYGARRGLPGLVQRARAVRDEWYRNHVLWLANVLVMTPAECEVLDAVTRKDRLWLTRNAGRFRRTRQEVRYLRAAFLSGLF